MLDGDRGGPQRADQPLLPLCEQKRPALVVRHHLDGIGHAAGPGGELEVRRSRLEHVERAVEVVLLVHGVQEPAAHARPLEQERGGFLVRSLGEGDGGGDHGAGAVGRSAGPSAAGGADPWRCPSGHLPMADDRRVGVDGVGSLAGAALGAVLGGAVFGDQCSPISDTTILSSLATGADLMDHVYTQLPLAIAAVVRGLFGVK